MSSARFNAEAPEVEVPDGWFPLIEGVAAREGFLSPNPPDRIRVKYFFLPSNGHLLAKVWFGPGSAGPPGHVHGGCQAAVLDEAMSLACVLAGLNVFTTSIHVGYRRRLPLGVDATVEAWVTEAKGRNISAEAKITAPDSGETFVDARGRFVAIDAESLASRKA